MTDIGPIDPDVVSARRHLLETSLAAEAGALRFADDFDAADRVAALDDLDDVLARARATIAKARANVIADVANAPGGSVRQAAVVFGISPAAVAKALARVARDGAVAPPAVAR